MTEEMKRPNHPDFMTTAELKSSKFSGVRQVKLTGDTEFWIDGELKKVVAPWETIADPDAIKKAHLELFALWGEEGNKE